MKGQFFLVGAILLASMFFVGLPLAGTSIRQISTDVAYLSDNAKGEFARTLNLGLDERNEVYAMLDYVRFLDRVSREHYINFSAFWFIAEPQGSGTVIRAGNYLGSDVNAMFMIEGNANILLIPHDSNSTATFAAVPDQFILNVTYGGNFQSVELVRNKVSLYASFWMSRGSDIVRKEFTI